MGRYYSNYRTPLVVVNGNLTAQQYITEVLQAHVVPFLQHHPDVTVFQQDNARPHEARVTCHFLLAQGVNVLPWPAYSPDLSPVEHLWDYLGRHVANRIPRPRNRNQLVQVLLDGWRQMPQDRIRRLIRSMRRRLISCVQAEGGHIRC